MAGGRTRVKGRQDYHCDCESCGIAFIWASFFLCFIIHLPSAGRTCIRRSLKVGRPGGVESRSIFERAPFASPPEGKRGYSAAQAISSSIRALLSSPLLCSLLRPSIQALNHHRAGGHASGIDLGVRSDASFTDRDSLCHSTLAAVAVAVTTQPLSVCLLSAACPDVVRERVHLRWHN